MADRLDTSDILNESDIQPHLHGGRLRFHDNGDPLDDADGHVNPAFDESSTDPTPDVNQNGHVQTTNGEIRLPPPPSKKDIRQMSREVKTEETLTFQTGTTLPVVYSNRSGNDVVIAEPVVVPQTGGGSAIQTRAIPDRWRDLDRPLRKRHLRILKAFGIIAIIFFFPTGIPACYYAFKAKVEFEEGIMRGNIDKAVKCAKRSERLIVLSGILALVFGILCFAMVERSLNPERYANWHPGGIVGQQ